MKWFARYGLLTYLLSATAFAEPIAVPDTLTLEQAQQLALQNHPRIAVSDLKVRAAKQDVKIARSNYLPQANGAAVRVFADDNTRIMAGSGISNPTILDRGAYGISASQLITDFGRTGDLVDASKLRVNAEKSRQDWTGKQILLNVTSAYYEVLRAQALLRVAKGTQKARGTFFEQTSELVKAHMKSTLDQNLAQQGVQEAKLLTLRAQGRLEDAKASLSEALGLPASRNIALVEPERLPDYPADITSLIDKASAQNPEILSLQAEVDAERKEADAEEKNSYPTVNALAYAGDTPEYESTASINRTYAAAGVNISIPFYTGGRLSAQHKKARYRASAAEQALAVRQHELARDVQTAWNNTQIAFENITVSESLMHNNNETLSLLEAGYELGRNSSVELAQAQLNATISEIGAANARYDYLAQLALLNYMIGGEAK